MIIAYFDCFSGISGDMILGALIDAGVDPSALEGNILRAGAPDFRLKTRTVHRGGLRGTAVEIVPKSSTASLKNLKALLDRIDRGNLATPLRKQSREIFTRLARAEARVHRISVQKVHFHEIGALDTFVDVVGAVVGLYLLGATRVCASAVNLGGGQTASPRNGKTLPLPAPATLELMKGCPIFSDGSGAELTTPTGAAILCTLSEGFGPSPAMTLRSVGYGAGGLSLPHPNLFRLWLGHDDPTTDGLDLPEELQVLETQIDDMNPQFYDHIMERLLDAGAVDGFLTPVIMKKGRPGTLITVLSKPNDLPGLIRLLLTETTTLGVRHYAVHRDRLRRSVEAVRTPHGPIRVKFAYLNGKPLQGTPEYDDLRAAAKASGQPILQVWADTLRSIPSGRKRRH